MVSPQSSAHLGCPFLLGASRLLSSAHRGWLRGKAVTAHRRLIIHCVRNILSHRLANGMVLVGEPTKSLESAAFTFLLAGRLLLRSAETGRAGLADGRDDAPRRRRRAIAGLGFRTSKISASSAANRSASRNRRITARRFATICTPGLSLFADLLRRPHLPRRSARSRPQRRACRNCGRSTMSRATSS